MRQQHTDVFVLCLHEKFLQFFLFLKRLAGHLGPTAGSGGSLSTCLPYVREMICQVVVAVAVAGYRRRVPVLASKHLPTQENTAMAQQFRYTGIS